VSLSCSSEGHDVTTGRGSAFARVINKDRLGSTLEATEERSDRHGSGEPQLGVVDVEQLVFRPVFKTHLLLTDQHSITRQHSRSPVPVIRQRTTERNNICWGKQLTLGNDQLTPSFDEKLNCFNMVHGFGAAANAPTPSLRSVAA
jgi:hypothetical protein